MLIALAILFLLVNAFFLVLVILGLPGNWFMVLAAAGCYWWQHGQSSAAALATNAASADGGSGGTARGPLLFGVTSLVVAAGFAVAGEIAEFVAGMAGAKKAGATWRGSLGAILGGLIGGIAATFFIPIPIIGSLIGACVGAAGGAWMFEYASGRRHEEALQAGVGAGVGRLMGTLIKLAFGVAIWITLTVASFM